MGSSIAFESCKFENGYHSKGGTLYIENSTVSFKGKYMFLRNTANYTAGAIYGFKSRIKIEGKSIFQRNIVGNYKGLNFAGTAVSVEYCNSSWNGNFKFNDNIIVRSVAHNNAGGTFAASYPLLKMNGVLNFYNNLNAFGGAIWLNNSKFSIYGNVTFESNEAFYDGGAISALKSSLTIKSKYFNMYKKYKYINSEIFHKSNPFGIIFCNNSAGKLGGAVAMHESNMTLSGSVIFVANKANRGGEISIYYTSDSRVCSPNFIIFQEPLVTLF